uniref:BPTI/Kunitz inhibitor domain-containing protein n=1 Tax=Zosterops lateralis melanops TaxID=1220523 RepID=A0A8D2PX32_ZOSLA
KALLCLFIMLSLSENYDSILSNHSNQPASEPDFQTQVIPLCTNCMLRYLNSMEFGQLTFMNALSDPRCLEPMKPGDCWNYVARWFYDKNGNSCGQFWYGGCNGSNNRFETEKECQETYREMPFPFKFTVT